MNGGEFLKTSHASKPQHRALSSSEGQVRILSPIVEPASGRLPSAGADFAQGGSIGPEFVGHDLLSSAMFAHCFLQEFQRGLLVSGLRNEAFKHLAFVIDSPPQIMCVAIDLHEHLVEVPSPTAGLHPLNPTLPDLGGKHRAEPMPPVSDRLVADIDAPFVQQILYVPERQREPDVQHHRQADDLWARFEVLEWGSSGHAVTLSTALPCLKPGFSDKSTRRHGQTSLHDWPFCSVRATEQNGNAFLMAPMPASRRCSPHRRRPSSR